MGKMNEINVLAWNAGIKTNFETVQDLKICVARHLLNKSTYDLLQLAEALNMRNLSIKELAQQYARLTRAEALHASHDDIYHHYQERNSDKTPLRARVSGRCQFWVTRPEAFSLPMKYGLKQSFRITEQNAWEWYKPVSA